VDAFLRGFPLASEQRTRDEKGKIHIERIASPPVGAVSRAITGSLSTPEPPERGRGGARASLAEPAAPPARGRAAASTASVSIPATPAQAFDEEDAGLEDALERSPLPVTKVYPYGVARNRLMQSARRIGVPAVVVRTIDEADALITLRSYYRDHQATIVEAERRGMPIYVLRANTVTQIEQFLTDLFNLPGSETGLPSSQGDEVRNETRNAIAAVMNGERYVDMPPASPIVRRIQHEMARDAELVSHSYGKEPRRYVRIFRD